MQTLIRKLRPYLVALVLVAISVANLLAGTVNVVTDHGAVANGTHDVNGVTSGTDNRAAFQAALDAAAHATTGYDEVFIPAGTYRISGPLRLSWATAKTIWRIRGEGSATTLMFDSLPEGRGGLELLGTSNSLAVKINLEDFRIICGSPGTGATQSHPGSYALRVGDAKQWFTARRLFVGGANGLLMRVSEATSYAHIGTLFEQCSFYANETEWWDPDPDEGRFFAVGVDTNVDAFGLTGASWDTVSFRSCSFNGLVETRAEQVVFDLCDFSSRTTRADDWLVDGRDYGGCLCVRLGRATLRDCYFEDYRRAITVTDWAGAVYSLIVDGCIFSGWSNDVEEVQATAGVAWRLFPGAGYGIKRIVIRDSRFEGEGHATCVVGSGARSVECSPDKNVNYTSNDPLIFSIAP